MVATISTQITPATRPIRLALRSLRESSRVYSACDISSSSASAFVGVFRWPQAVSPPSYHPAGPRATAGPSAARPDQEHAADRAGHVVLGRDGGRSLVALDRL